MASESSNGAPHSAQSEAPNKPSAALLTLRTTLQRECKALLSDMDCPRLIEGRIADLERQAAEILQIAEAKLTILDTAKSILQYRLANTRTMYIEACERLDECNRQIKLAANASTIDKIEELKRQIAALEAEGVKG